MRIKSCFWRMNFEWGGLALQDLDTNKPVLKAKMCNIVKIFKGNCDIKWLHLKMQSFFAHYLSPAFASELQWPARTHLNIYLISRCNHSPSLYSTLSGSWIVYKMFCGSENQIAFIILRLYTFIVFSKLAVNWGSANINIINQDKFHTLEL